MPDRYFLDADNNTVYKMTAPKTEELRNGGVVVAWHHSTAITTLQTGKPPVTEEKSVIFEAYQYEKEDGVRHLLKKFTPPGIEIEESEFLSLTGG